MKGRIDIYRFLIPVIAMSLTGCLALSQHNKLPEERVAIETSQASQEIIPLPVQPAPEKPSEGSLWQPNGAMGSLFVDYKARAVGDIVTIKIVEDAKASNDAGTNTGKSSEMSAQVTSFLGTENKYTSTDTPNPFGKIAGGLDNTFAGTGKTERSGTIKAEITARVMDVLPGGNLRIAGTRVITINSERQFIVLAGIIRPRDISSDNKIESTRISDARIVYSGIGVVDEQQRQGWLASVLNAVWPL